MGLIKKCDLSEGFRVDYCSVVIELGLSNISIYVWERPRVRSNTSFNIFGRVSGTRGALVKNWTNVIRVLLSHSSC